MESKPNNFKALQVLHNTLLTGMIVFSIIAFILTVMRKTAVVDVSSGKILQVSVLLLAISSVSTSFFLFNKQVQSMATTATAAERISVYRAAAILRWAMIEGPALFTIICFMLTGNYAFLTVAIALIIVFVRTAPAKTKVIQLLQLNDEEVAQLEGSSE